jgi:glycosyltransferase involved in cell wall biosynthesis
MPLVSVLTPVNLAGADWLDATAASVAALVAPAGWEVEWVVQEDGALAALEDRVTGLGGRYEANGLQAGVAGTRNFALLRVRGDVVMTLDADDLVLPDALDRLLPHLTGDRTWVCGGHVDGDGIPDLHWDPAAARAWAPGDLLRHGSRGWGFHPNNLLVRTDALWRAGGWPGLSGMEDKLLVMRLNSVDAGASTDVPTVVYRRHPAQAIGQARFRDRLPDYHRFVTAYAEASLRS